MIGNVNTNQAVLWHNVSGQAKKQHSTAASFSVNTGGNIQLRMDALVSGAIRIPGATNMMSASVFKAEGFSADNPIMLVKGIDVDGTAFEVEVNINDVNPRNASFVEMFALDGYFAVNGKPSNVTRTAAKGMALDEGQSGNNAFTKFDFVASLLEHLETQRFHRNWEAVALLNPLVDTLMNHIDRR